MMSGALLRSFGRLVARPLAHCTRVCLAAPSRALPPSPLLSSSCGRGVAGVHQLLQRIRYSSHTSQERRVHVSASSKGSEGGGPGQKLNRRITERIGVIGAGQMGEALIRGFIKAGISSPGRISCSVNTLDRQQLLEDMGVGNIFDDAEAGGARDVAAHSDIIFLAVKPQVMQPILEALAPHITPRHLIISIAAGIKLSTMQAALGPDARVVRVMPNTPCLVQCGASAYAMGKAASPDDADLVHELLSSVGLAIMVDEKMMDAVTGLSGSGPAYVFLVIEALADGGVAAGLPRETALALAAKTVAGAARMVLDDSSSLTVHPGVLKDRVASPAGTTIAGLMELESSGVRGAVMRAVKAAAKRSEELG